MTDVTRLAAVFVERARALDWPARIELFIGELDGIADTMGYATAIVEFYAPAPVCCAAQAALYAASGDPRHNALTDAWLDKPPSPSERRQFNALIIRIAEGFRAAADRATRQSDGLQEILAVLAEEGLEHTDRPIGELLAVAAKRGNPRAAMMLQAFQRPLAG